MMAKHDPKSLHTEARHGQYMHFYQYPSLDSATQSITIYNQQIESLHYIYHTERAKGQKCVHLVQSNS